MKRRALLLLGVSLCGYGVLVGRLFQLQIVRYEYYSEKARTKCLHLEITEAPRGPILDRNGIPLAHDATTYDLAVIPARIDRTLILALRLKRAGLKTAAQILQKTKDPQKEHKGLLLIGRLTRGQLHRILRHPLDENSFLTVRKGETVYLFARPGLLAELKKRLQEIASLASQKVQDLLRRYERVRRRIFDCQNAYTRRHLLLNPHVIAENIPRMAAMRVEVERWRLPGVLVLERRRRRYAGEAFGTLLGSMRLINKQEAEKLKAEGRIIARGYNPPHLFEKVAEKDCYFWDEHVGAFRLEKYFERRLRGRKGARLLERDIETGGYRVLNEVEAVPGEAVRLTIDARLQEVAYNALKECGAKGAAVLVDPNTGAILAMASYPSFDPQRLTEPAYYREILRGGGLLERCAGCCYAPGSTVKVLAAVAALAEGTITKKTKIECRGFYRSKRAFRCWVYPNAHGKLCVKEAIERSCNVFFFDVAERMGGSRLAEWLHRFGLGEKPADIPWAKKGFVPSPANRRPWFRGFARLMAIGQGEMLASPLQIARAFCAIATGKLVTLRLFRRTSVVRRPLRVGEEVLAVVRDGMRLAVRGAHGTARKAGLEKFDAAAKTGTAEVSKRLGLNNAWIAGFAPFDDPRVVFVVLVERVKGHGGEVAGPVAARILEAFFGNDLNAKR